MLLPEFPRVSGQADVTVIIPARNEERVIARAISSFPTLRVLVVDDASDDATVVQARKAGAEVVQAPALTPGMMGKPNACYTGAAAAHSKWLLFVDADTWYAPEFAASLITYAESEGLDVASVFLRQHARTVAERILLPYAFALYFCGVSAHRVNSERDAEALANGQCLLVRREAYERAGTHVAVAGSVIEDVAFARLAKTKGMRVRVLRCERLGNVRMYDSFTAIRRGFEKNSFRFLRANPRTGLQVILASILLTSWLPVVVIAARRAPLLAIVVLLAPTFFLIPWYGSLRRALAAPIAIYVFQLIALSGMIRTLTGTRTLWKGRYV